MQLNDGYEYREQLGIGASEQTVLDYLSQRYRHSTRDEWLSRIHAGLVFVDTIVATPDTRLKSGAMLVWQRPPWVEPEAPCSFELLYEDSDLLAVAKPAGLPTMPGANFLQSTLLYQVQRVYPDATPVHRLGRWTSGIVLCARNPEVRNYLTRLWSTQQIGKRYRALASGNPVWEQQTITTPIGLVPHELLGNIHAACDHGKPAESHVSIVERRADSFLCDVWITTGRPHQIRIHLAAAGHPLVGDPLYIAGGVPATHSRAVPGDAGYHLHATELCFQHPVTQQPITIMCEPPTLLR